MTPMLVNNTPLRPALFLNGEDISYNKFVALKQVSLTIYKGEKVAIIGQSGAGKTTLLRRLFQLGPDQCAFVHQHYALVPQLSVFHNIYMGRLDQFSLVENIRNLISPSSRRINQIQPIARRLGLENKLMSRTSTLSGGQQQRVGIGRALYRGGDILMADEPVSSLDRMQQESVMRLLTDTEKTVVSSLHSIDLARQFFNRIIAIRDRAVAFDLPVKEVTDSRLDRLYG